jgi:hypothetical protein
VSAPATAADAGLRAALCAGAAGCWPEEAAIGLLTTAAEAVWRSPAWQQACVALDQLQQDGVALVLAEVDWQVAVEAARIVQASPAQIAVVQVAAAIATGPLGAGLRDLDPDDLGPVLTALAHVVTGPPTY